MTKSLVWFTLLAGVAGAVLGGGAVFALMAAEQTESKEIYRMSLVAAGGLLDEAEGTIAACQMVIENYSDVSVSLASAVADQRSAIDTFFTRYDWWAGDAGHLYNQLDGPSDDLSDAIADMRSTDFELDGCYRF